MEEEIQALKQNETVKYVLNLYWVRFITRFDIFFVQPKKGNLVRDAESWANRPNPEQANKSLW